MFDYKISTREKDGKFQWIIAYKDNTGKWRQKAHQNNKYTTSKKAEKGAQEYLDTLKEELKKEGKLNKDYKNMTFKEFSEMYLDHKKAHSEYNTLRRFKNSISKFNELNNLKMKEINITDIQSIVDNMIKSENLKASTIISYKRTVSTMFEAAVNQFQVISENPFKKVVLPKKNKVDRRALTEEEINDLLSKIEDKKYYLISLIAVKCGLRIGEIVGLTWNDIKDNGVINIDKQWKELDDKTYGIGNPKSINSFREVTMPKIVRKELAKYRLQGVINKKHRLFNYVNIDSLEHSLRRCYRRAGYEISVHELRHTYASLLIIKGLKHYEAAKVLGHTTQENIRTYSHLTDDNEKRVEKIILENF